MYICNIFFTIQLITMQMDYFTKMTNNCERSELSCVFNGTDFIYICFKSYVPRANRAKIREAKKQLTILKSPSPRSSRVVHQQQQHHQLLPWNKKAHLQKVLVNSYSLGTMYKH